MSDDNANSADAESADAQVPGDLLAEDAAEPGDSDDAEVSADQDDVQVSESAEVLEIPRFARLAGWFGFFLPPAGAVMGHLWLAWEGKQARAPGRRHAVTGVIVGWIMTFVLVVVGLVVFTLWSEATEAERIQQQELAAVLEAAEDSPSTGEVDTAACDAIFAVVSPQDPPENLDQLIDNYEAIDAGQSPNDEVYAAYVEFLTEFDSAEEVNDLDQEGRQQRDEKAAAANSALFEDSLGCVALDESYFMDTISEPSAAEF